MSIADIKHMGKFHVDFFRVVLDLPHQEIADYTMKFLEEKGSDVTFNKERKRIYTTYHSTNLNEEWQKDLPGREEFEADVKKLGHEWMKRTNRKPFKEDPHLFYWGSVYKEHDQHGSHIHPNSNIAGTYYPQVGQHSSGITYEAPWTHHIMHDSMPFERSLWDYKPSQGDCMLWPSWISHRVSPQKKDKVLRVAISFNLDYSKYHD